ncbi:MAG: ABC transporter permease [Bacteroidetes bacterium]|nr:ABC transporter permease [Bacteroidota bacterium]
MAKPELQEDNSGWDILIKPRSNWFRLDLHGVWQYRDLIRLLIRRDFLSAYKQTILGPVWMLLQPLVNTLMYFFVFVILVKMKTGPVPPILFIMSAVIPWGYFSDCLNKTSITFSSNASIFGKVYFPRLVTPVSVVISFLIKLGVQLLMLLIIYVFYVAKGAPVHPNIFLAYLPLLIVLLAGYSLSFGLIISAITNKYRDLTFLVGVGIQALMYASSVVIPVDMFGPRVMSVLKWNPLLQIIRCIRYSILDYGSWSWMGLGYAGGILVVLLLFSIMVFNRVEKNVMDTV